MIAINRVIPGMQKANLTTLAAVASRSLEKAQDVAARFAVPKAYGTYEELLADPDIEAVYIPLPNGFHAEWSIKALRAGKHVLCEKPLAMDAAEARQIQTVRDETSLYCLEAFAYRFNPVVAKAIEIARSGVLGELRFLHTISNFLMGDPDPAKALESASGVDITGLTFTDDEPAAELFPPQWSMGNAVDRRADDLAALAFGMRMEQEAIELYDGERANTLEPAAQKAYRFLVEEEIRHYDQLKEQWERLSGRPFSET